jgi:HSP20 family molecular chaperone IbpA
MNTENLTHAPVVERPRVRPLTDIYETADSLVLVADVPGADQDSIELSLSEGVLGLRARPRLDAPAGWQPAEAGLELPEYERSFALNAEVESDSIGATLKNGRLRVVLKKVRPQSHRIEVRAG